MSVDNTFKIALKSVASPSTPSASDMEKLSILFGTFVCIAFFSLCIFPRGANKPQANSLFARGKKQNRFKMEVEIKRNLDIIDYLRSRGLSEHISLPQIIVIGDQSSGKSSLLEVISGVNFPKSPDLCTRFVTEVRMRDRSPARMTIECDGEKQILTSLEDIAAFDIESFIKSHQDSAGEDIVDNKSIVIEICKPGGKNLTVVDIPGIIHTTMANQDPRAKELIDSMVHRHASQAKSIILAVIPANKDLATNVVLSVAEKYDPEGNRTIGVLTKPDLVDKGTEGTVVDIVKGKKKILKLGYYVVRNRSHQEVVKGVDLDTLRRLEKDFFCRPEWAELDQSRAGIDNLMRVLSHLLAEHVQSHLPGLREEVQRKLDELTAQLDRLGQPMDTDSSKYHVLFDSARQFHAKFKGYVEGSPQFLLSSYASAAKIPEALQNGKNGNGGAPGGGLTAMFSSSGYRGALLQLTHRFERKLSEKLPWSGEARETTLANLTKLISLHRGKEIAGFLPYNLFVIIVNDVIQKWKEPSMDLLSRVYKLLWTMAQAICEDAGAIDSRVAGRLKNAYGDVFRAQLARAQDTCKEMLADEASWPFTMHPYYKLTVSKLRAPLEGDEAKIKQALLARQNLETSQYHEFDAQDMSVLLEAYVNATVKRYVDAFVLYCVERHLIRNLLQEIEQVPKHIDIKQIRESATIAKVREDCTKGIESLSAAYDKLSTC